MADQPEIKESQSLSEKSEASTSVERMEASSPQVGNGRRIRIKDLVGDASANSTFDSAYRSALAGAGLERWNTQFDAMKATQSVLSGAAGLPVARLEKMSELLGMSKATYAMVTDPRLSTVTIGDFVSRWDLAKAVSTLFNATKFPPVAELLGLSAQRELFKTARSAIGDPSGLPSARLEDWMGEVNSAKAARAVLTGVSLPSVGAQLISAQIRSNDFKKQFASVLLDSKAFQSFLNSNEENWDTVTSGFEVQPSTLDLQTLENPSDIAAAEAELVDALSTKGNLHGVSSRAKGWLTWMFIIFISLMNYLAIENGVREELCFLQPKLMPGLTLGQTGKAIRTALCNAEQPVEHLKNYRLVDGLGVRLRDQPSMSATVVQVRIPDRAVLEVLDSSNRDWLYVSVIGEEDVTGWVSRKYTYPLLR